MAAPATCLNVYERGYGSRHLSFHSSPLVLPRAARHTIQRLAPSRATPRGQYRYSRRNQRHTFTGTCQSGASSALIVSTESYSSWNVIVSKTSSLVCAADRWRARSRIEAAKFSASSCSTMAFAVWSTAGTVDSCWLNSVFSSTSSSSRTIEVRSVSTRTR